MSDKNNILRGGHEHIDLDRLIRERPEEKDDEPDKMTGPPINSVDWFSHALLVAAQGSGKTNLIRWRIQQILPLIRQGKATLILLDPKDVLTKELPTLARSLGIGERTVLIDPIESPVSFNLFDRGNGSRAAVHDTIARLVRVLNTITSDLTDFQRDTLSLAINALFASSDNPQFEGLFPILRHGKDAILLDKLPKGARDIFEHDFKPSEGRFVISRLNSFRHNPYFEPLVTGSAPLFDLASEIQEGKMILIKAGVSEPLYGKIWIEQIDRIIDSRFAMQESERTPTFVIIDEAQIFIGDSENQHFADILDRAREAKIGMLIACQHMEQIRNVHVRTSLYNSALKFISRTNGDTHNLARSMSGDIDAKRLSNVPRYHFVFQSPDVDEPRLVKFPLIEPTKWMPDDIKRFQRQMRPPMPPAPPSAPQVAPKAPPPPIADGPTDNDPYDTP